MHGQPDIVKRELDTIFEQNDPSDPAYSSHAPNNPIKTKNLVELAQNPFQLALCMTRHCLRHAATPPPLPPRTHLTVLREEAPPVGTKAAASLLHLLLLLLLRCATGQREPHWERAAGDVNTAAGYAGTATTPSTATSKPCSASTQRSSSA